MSTRFFLAILVLAGVFWGAAGWCEKTHFYEISGSKINEVDISPDRSMLITASDSKNMIVWNFTSLSPLYTLPCNTFVQSAKFSKDGAYIAVGQANATVNIIQVSTFTSVKNITTGLTSVK
jgi:WD40 repeat protein